MSCWRFSWLAVCGVLIACAHAPWSGGEPELPRLFVSRARRERIAELAPDLAAQAAAAEREWARRVHRSGDAERQQIAESLWLAAEAEADRIAAERAYMTLQRRRWAALEQAATVRRDEARIRHAVAQRDCAAARFTQMQGAYGQLALCAAHERSRGRCPALSEAQQRVLLAQARLMLGLGELFSPSAQGQQVRQRLERLEGQPSTGRSFSALEGVLRNAEQCLGDTRGGLQTGFEAQLASAAEAAQLRGLSAVVEPQGLRVSWPEDRAAERVALYAAGALLRLFPQMRSTLIVALPADGAAQSQLRLRARAAQRGLAGYGVATELAESPVDAITPGILWRLTFPTEGSGRVDG